MALGGIFGKGSFEDYLSDPRMALAQRLMAQGSDTGPIEHWTQGLARLAQALVGAKMYNKGEAESNAADEALLRGLTAKQWVNPDTGTSEVLAERPMQGEAFNPLAARAPAPQAGGLGGAQAALQGLGDNRYAGRLAKQLGMFSAVSDIENDALAAAEARELENAKALKRYDADLPQYGKNTPYPEDVQQQMLDIAKAKAEAQQRGATPYFTFIPTTEGIVAGNNRAGTITPVADSAGRPLVKPGDDPATQGGIAKAKVIGEAAGKREITMSGIGDVIAEAESVLNGAVKPTGSGVGALVDIAGAYVGASPEGAAEADRLRAIGGALVAKMPRMEGPQSDKDTLNYKEMAGQVGDSTLPIERRKAALATVKELWAKYDKGVMGKSNEMQGDSFDEIYEQLPSGAMFTAPDGSRRRKP